MNRGILSTFRLAWAVVALAISAGACNARGLTYDDNLNMDYKLAPGAQLVSMSWDEDGNLWVLSFTPKSKTCLFAESSRLGLIQKTITVHDCNLAALPLSPTGAPAAAPNTPVKR